MYGKGVRFLCILPYIIVVSLDSFRRLEGKLRKGSFCTIFYICTPPKTNKFPEK